MSCYSITKNDLKYKNKRNLDKNKITTLDVQNKNEYDAELTEMYFNQNLDTLEYRYNECRTTGKCRILDLSNLELTHFPKIPSDLINTLEELYMSDNLLDVIPDLDYLKKLKILDISVNNLLTINKLPKTLVELCCFDNKISNIHNVSYCNQLKILYISNNLISNLDFLNNHPTLEILNANFNNLTDIPRNLCKLRKLYIKNNKLTKIKSYPKLEYLDCRNNKISLIEPQESLLDLIVSYNNIEEIPVINTLKYLEIVHTNIHTINFMKNLEELICLSSSLKQISSQFKIENSQAHNSKYLVIYFMPQ